ncbi:MAG TPA: GNAT family N-acetyltransferase [Lacunisphaera sp.]|nr:GNAT family N-acetyltransferase [Lacunisphaera sp.]
MAHHRANDLTIRRCAVGDEHVLALVGQAAFLEAFAGEISGQDLMAHCRHQHSVEKYAAWLADGHTAIWIAEVDPGRAPIGYLVLTSPDLPLPDLTAQDLEVKRIYLLHRFQGGGLGARLMDEARRHAEAVGCRRLLLGVYRKNAAAIGFYERLGYRRVGTRSFKVGENIYQDLILALAL